MTGGANRTIIGVIDSKSEAKSGPEKTSMSVLEVCHANRFVSLPSDSSEGHIHPFLHALGWLKVNN